MKRKVKGWLRNKYIVASAIFLVWTCFINDIDLLYVLKSYRELQSMRAQYTELKKANLEAAKDLHLLTTNDATREKFARETYYFKYDNEDVFVFRETED